MVQRRIHDRFRAFVATVFRKPRTLAVFFEATTEYAKTWQSVNMISDMCRVGAAEGYGEE